MSAARGSAGVTLLELMIVVAILPVLAAVGAPKLTAMVARSKEGATKGNLGSIRSALAVYYADNEGAYPEDALESLENGGKYISGIPAVNIYDTFRHPPGSGVAPIASLGSILPDTGGWAYVYSRSSPDWGKVVINCSHPDLNGQPWSRF